MHSASGLVMCSHKPVVLVTYGLAHRLHIAVVDLSVCCVLSYHVLQVLGWCCCVRSHIPLDATCARLVVGCTWLNPASSRHFPSQGGTLILCIRHGMLHSSTSPSTGRIASARKAAQTWFHTPCSDQTKTTCWAITQSNLLATSYTGTVPPIPVLRPGNCWLHAACQNHATQPLVTPLQAPPHTNDPYCERILGAA